ncbi:MAG: TIGR04076 family protein [Coriobacteriia bacterium]|nr:TIGR04076 family protein [Coriobacteriia bacterium]
MEPVGHRVRVEVVEIMGGGRCPAGIEVGRVWEVVDGTVPEGMCASAFHTVHPFVMTLRFGGVFPWSGGPRARLCCPDAENPVVFVVERDET